MIHRTITKRKLLIRRGTGEVPGYFTEHWVPTSHNKTVLDALLYVQRQEDPTLAFRFACRKGMCGTCGVRVNGVERLACSTLLRAVPGQTVRIEPLRHLPIIRDLAVDFTPFFQRWTNLIGPLVSRAQELPVLESPGASSGSFRWGDCISCALCYSACDTVGRATGFAGPAALNRALVLSMDPTRVRLNYRTHINQLSGALGCHSMGLCTLVCPKGLDPARAIQRLRLGR
ncbi:MAG: 2Fe-2S iron-sulfur cluster-binding protein [Candidatus Methanomethylicaceae archaeon]